MKNPFAKIFTPHPKPLPKNVVTALNNSFPGAKNIEWELKKGNYEAIFYLEDVEHIALFSSDGELKEHKKNLWPNELPAKITEECNQLGEIMNAIVISKEGKQLFEVIVRDSKFKRKLYLFNEAATLLDTHKL